MLTIRLETSLDHPAIRQVNLDAFRNHPVSRQTEHRIVDALRAADALELSLVADLDGSVVGHIAFSPAQIGDHATGWYLLGPLAVLPAFQRRGIGRMLVEAGLVALRARHAAGCVLVGNPAYYTRFGFQQLADITYPGVPDQYVLTLPLAGLAPQGTVTSHPAFDLPPE
ncbi:MAG: N-acetyltransferase [Gemmataceae bacterium]